MRFGNDPVVFSEMQRYRKKPDMSGFFSRNVFSQKCNVMVFIKNTPRDPVVVRSSPAWGIEKNNFLGLKPLFRNNARNICVL
jgi:hypothetical protein